jgi:hypothetical protein
MPNRYTCLNPASCDCGRADSGEFCRHWGEPPAACGNVVRKEAADEMTAAQDQDMPEIKHLPPEPMDSRERTLHFWLARLTSYPRWVSIGSIDSHAELQRVSREDYETIQAVLRGK